MFVFRRVLSSSGEVAAGNSRTSSSTCPATVVSLSLHWTAQDRSSRQPWGYTGKPFWLLFLSLGFWWSGGGFRLHRGHRPPWPWWQQVVASVLHFLGCPKYALMDLGLKYFAIYCYIWSLLLSLGFPAIPATTGHRDHGGRWWWLSSTCLGLIQILYEGIKSFIKW